MQMRPDTRSESKEIRDPSRAAVDTQMTELLQAKYYLLFYTHPNSPIRSCNSHSCCQQGSHMEHQFHNQNLRLQEASGWDWNKCFH